MYEFDKMVQLLNMSYYLKNQIVPCLIGPAGIGKTAAVMKHARSVGAEVTTIIASQISPNEVSGITMPDTETKCMEIYDHFKLGHLKDGDIIFFDELLEADQSVLSACLTLIESRMMMSGKLLPDVQIIAATNPTIMPSSLKENIRQRFMFMEFKIDKCQTHDYIKEKTNIDLSNDILNQLESQSDQYNILTPRSLTKLCEWFVSVPVEARNQLALFINEMWKSNIGSTLLDDVLKMDSPENKVRRAIKELVDIDANFDDCTFTELIDILKKLDNWGEIQEKLLITMVPEDTIMY